MQEVCHQQHTYMQSRACHRNATRRMTSHRLLASRSLSIAECTTSRQQHHVADLYLVAGERCTLRKPWLGKHTRWTMPT